MSFLIGLLAPKVGELAARAIIYAIIVAVIGGALLGIRQHYINMGWYKYKAVIEKQNDAAAEASRKVEEQTNKCSDASGYWDVITQGCKLQEEEKKQ